MATLSSARLSVPTIEGLELVSRGKVRDTYRILSDPRLEARLGKLLLVVASDGISIFDFVLNALIPYKGYVLTAMTHFWLRHLESTGVQTHFVAAGAAIDTYLPPHLRGNSDLQRRGMVVMELEMIPIEFIARFYLTGSVLKEYQTSGTVYGTELPKGLVDGDKLPAALFTPTTKAVDGHDEPEDAVHVRDTYTSETEIFLTACNRCIPLAAEKGLLIADTKGEIGYGLKRIIRMGDEWLTPDSSRFWDAAEHAASRSDPLRKVPQPLDKQLMRAFGALHGINMLDPKKPSDVATAHALTIPATTILATAQTYLAAFTRLTGLSIEEYATQHLRVSL